MRILITGGGTEETIDAARCITNFSTGKTATSIVDYLTEKNVDICFIINSKMEYCSSAVKVLKYKSFLDLDNTLQSELSSNSYDFVIHLAAVSDYSVDKIICNNEELLPDENLKLPSSSKISIELKKNFKIVNRLHEYSKNKNIKVIAFKLTQNAISYESKIADIVSAGNVDFVVHNELKQIKEDLHPTQIFDSNLNIIATGNTKLDLSKNLYQLLEQL